jgi:hypothetical protein
MVVCTLVCRRLHSRCGVDISKLSSRKHQSHGYENIELVKNRKVRTTIPSHAEIDSSTTKLGTISESRCCVQVGTVLTHEFT